MTVFERVALAASEGAMQGCPPPLTLIASPPSPRRHHPFSPGHAATAAQLPPEQCHPLLVELVLTVGA